MPIYVIVWSFQNKSFLFRQSNNHKKKHIAICCEMHVSVVKNMFVYCVLFRSQGQILYAHLQYYCSITLVVPFYYQFMSRIFNTLL